MSDHRSEPEPLRKRLRAACWSRQQAGLPLASRSDLGLVIPVRLSEVRTPCNHTEDGSAGERRVEVLPESCPAFLDSLKTTLEGNQCEDDADGGFHVIEAPIKLALR